MHSALHRALNQAVMWGFIYWNPTDEVSSPRLKKKVPITLSEEQVRQLLKATEDHIFFPIYVLALHSMRKSEILGLRWKNVDLEKGTISVVATRHNSM